MPRSHTRHYKRKKAKNARRLGLEKERGKRRVPGVSKAPKPSVAEILDSLDRKEPAWSHE